MRPTPSAERPLRWSDLQSYFPPGHVGRSLVPLPDLELLYVRNPKAGSSTLLVWLIRLHTGNLDSTVDNPRTGGHLPKVVDAGRARVLRMLQGEAYRFSFVRDPVRRFESVYWDKLAPVSIRRAERYRALVQRTLGQPVDPDATPTFEEFLSAVEQQDPVTEMDPHWRPQHINLMHPAVSYDRIGRLESFNADLAVIREEAGLPEVPLERRNHKAAMRPSSPYEGRPDLVSRVEQLYATDMELYGY